MKIDKSQLIIKKLTENELDIYLEYIAYVKVNMEHPEWLGNFSKEDLAFLMNNNTEIYIWTFGENLEKPFTDINQFVGSGIIIPSTQKDLEKFLQIDSNFEEVIDMGPEAVHPDYIGNGLQSDIIIYLENVAKEKGYKYALGTVAPDNIYSIRNLLKNDYEIVARVELKRGTREVLRKKLV